MLDRTKLFKVINQITDKLFLDLSSEFSLAHALWQQLLKDESFQAKVRAARSSLLIPTWFDKLDCSYQITPFADSYCIVSVDGSQIYPDRHQGTSCFLINIGSVTLWYGFTNKKVHLSSEPFVYAEDDEHNFDLTTELVNCRRQELELQLGFDASKKIIQENPEIPFLFLCDGSLIFWHLQAKEVEIKDYFLCKYLQVMDQFYREKILMAGYISAPKSKELVNLLRLQLCNFDVSECVDFHKLDHLVDASIAHFFLKPFTRSIVFANQSPITNYYPPHLKPYFFYVDFGSEIARVEIPAWIARESDLVDKVAQIICDQNNKGYGYPIAIAEAHEQAVVKGHDREFFYQLIQKISIQHKKQFSISQKSQKKRRIGI